ncbi:MAG: tubulin-tyrosine ligase [Legionellales bacterium]
MLHHRFHLRALQSPTYTNLCRYLQEQGWVYTRFNGWAHFGEKNFQFDSAAAEQLEFKHLLAQLTAEYCPQVMPETYLIDDQNWPVVLHALADKYYMNNNQLLDQIEGVVWILKPSKLNNGQHIKIFQKLSDIERHYSSAQRMGGEHVLQRYLSQPHLLRKHKYSIRMFVLITNYSGAYLYPHGYINVALAPYQPENFTQLHVHLTNEHLKEDELNTVQIPTQRMDVFASFYPQIQTILSRTIHALKEKHPRAFLATKNQTLAIFGFDFMVDTDMRLWLLEANHGPCFPSNDEHPLQHHLYYDFWQAFIGDFVVPIAKRQQTTAQFFEKIL